MSEVLLADRGSVLLPVWAGEADGAALYAAQELVHFLSEITGIAYPFLRGGAAPESSIAVAKSADPSLGDEGFTIKARGSHVRIEGGLSRGVVYGVYDFLERIGCRWFSSKASQIPRRSRLAVPELDIRQVPVLEYRDICSPDARDPYFAIRNKYNGNCSYITPAQGGKVTYYPFVHTFNTLIPPDKYFDSHPEYFSLVDGKRLKENTQLCLTNPDVKRLAVEAVEKWISDHPEATIFSVSQNDCFNPCDCDSCKKINAEEGSRSGSLIHFVNHIAEAIEKKHPHVVIDTLAYQWSRPAPKKVRPKPNVCVRLCSIECCFSHPLRSCNELGTAYKMEFDDSFQKNLKDWSRVCDRLYIWDYVVNFSHYLLPFPNFHVLADNIKFFIENNVKGVFEEDAATDYRGTEFAELRAWVIGKLLWDPCQDTDKLVHEFITGYYKMAADPIREYFHLIHDAAAKDPNTHFGIYRLPDVKYLTTEIVEQCHALFARALALADDDETLRRVRIAALPIRYYDLYTTPASDPKRAESVDCFLADLVELNVHQIREGRSFQDTAKQLKSGQPVLQHWISIDKPDNVR